MRNVKTAVAVALLAATVPMTASAWNFGFSDSYHPGYSSYGPDRSGWSWGSGRGPDMGGSGPDFSWGSNSGSMRPAAPGRTQPDASANRGASGNSGPSTFSWGSSWSPRFGDGWGPGRGAGWGFNPGWNNGYPPRYYPYAAPRPAPGYPAYRAAPPPPPAPAKVPSSEARHEPAPTS